MKSKAPIRGVSTWFALVGSNRACALICVICCAFTVAMTRPQGAVPDKLTAKLVVAERVVVRSGDGSIIELGVLDYGESNRSAGLILRDPLGVERAVLRFDEGAPSLELTGPDAELAFELYVERNGFSGLSFIQGERARASMISRGDEGASVILIDKNGKTNILPD